VNIQNIQRKERKSRKERKIKEMEEKIMAESELDKFNREKKEKETGKTGTGEDKTVEDEKIEKETFQFGPEKVLKLVLRWVSIILAALFIIAFALGWWLSNWNLTRALVGAIGITGLIGLLLGVELYRSKVKVPAQPHSVGIITILGSKKDHLRVTDGVYPSIGGTGRGTGILDYLIVEAQQVDQDFDTQKVVTKDGVTLTVQPMIYWRPELRNLREYIIAGGKSNVMVLIDNKVPQLTTNWCKLRELDDVLKLDIKEVEKILADLVTGEVGIQGDRMDGEEKKTVQEILGIKIIDFNLNIISIDSEVTEAMKQKKIEDLQRTSEKTEIETEIIQANQLCEEAKKQNEPMTFEKAYKIVKIIKTNRELGVAPVLGLDDAFGNGTAGIAEAALMAFTGIMKKPVDGTPFNVAKGQQKPLVKKKQESTDTENKKARRS